MRAVAVAVATSVPSSVRSSPARNAIDPPRATTRPSAKSGPGLAGLTKFTLSSSVGANWSGSSVDCSAGPSVSSSIAARKPPWTTPIGFANSGRAVKRTRIVPFDSSISSSSKPSSTAAGGGARRPSITSQK